MTTRSMTRGTGSRGGGPGLSAYEVAVANGFVGTEAQWLASLVGADGDQGPDGLSAYEVAVANGFVGTESAWLASLVGPPGTTDHGAQTGLGDDDHTQYALADGSRGAFAATVHGHTTSDVTGLAEFVRDTIGSALVQGSNVTITVNDGADTITIAAAATAPAGNTGEVQFNNGGAFGAAADVEIEGGNLVFVGEASALTPSTDRLSLQARMPVTPLIFPEFVWPTGKTAFPMLVGETSGHFAAIVGNAGLQGTGLLFSQTGTTTTTATANTSRYTRSHRVEALVTVAAATAVAGFRTAGTLLHTPTLTSGGYLLRMVGGPATGVATATSRFFMGVRGNAAPTDVEPSSLPNIIGLAYDSADATVQIMHNDGAGTATKINTGITTPSADRTALFELWVYQPPNTTSVAYVFVRDVINGTTFTATITTDLPAGNTGEVPAIWSSAGGTSSVIGVALSQCSYIGWL